MTKEILQRSKQGGFRREIETKSCCLIFSLLLFSISNKTSLDSNLRLAELNNLYRLFGFSCSGIVRNSVDFLGRVHRRNFWMILCILIHGDVEMILVLMVTMGQ